MIRLGVAGTVGLGIAALAWWGAAPTGVAPPGAPSEPAAVTSTNASKAAGSVTPALPTPAVAPQPGTMAVAPVASSASAAAAEPAGVTPEVSAVAAASEVMSKPSPEQAPMKADPPRPKLPRGPHLQAGVFAQAQNAEELKAKLEAEGLPVYIESRVQIGPFKTRKEAERMREKLKAEGVTTVLIAQ